MAAKKSIEQQINSAISRCLKGLETWISPPVGFGEWYDFFAKDVKKERLKTVAPPKPYKSWLEFRLHHTTFPCLQYEPFSVPYVKESRHKYIPDFVDKDNCTYYEAKGRFRTRAEANKYLHVRGSLSPFEEIVFVFSKPGVKMVGAKKRKNGSVQTQEEWAIKNGFQVMFEDE